MGLLIFIKFWQERTGLDLINGTRLKKHFFIENIRERIKTKLLNLRQMETRAQE